VPPDPIANSDRPGDLASAGDFSQVTGVGPAGPRGPKAGRPAKIHGPAGPSLDIRGPPGGATRRGYGPGRCRRSPAGPAVPRQPGPAASLATPADPVKSVGRGWW